MSDIVEAIENCIGTNAVLKGDAVRERISVWGTNQPMEALAIVRPKNTDEVSSILRLCNEEGQPIVPQGGMTGLVKAGMSNSSEIAFSMERMNSIIDVDFETATMTVEAGVTLQEAQEAADAHDLMLPLDLGARGSATIGGNLSTNAGGNRVIRYGMTREMVLGVEAVLADGTILSSLNKVLKNNTGYDLKQLFIGGEGTLGVITKVVLRLRPKPKSENTAFVSINDFTNVVKLLRRLEVSLSGTLSAFEVMWSSAYKVLTGDHSHNSRPFPIGASHFVLVEALGGDLATDKDRFENALGEALQTGLVTDALVAQSESERKSFWNIRDDIPAIRSEFRDGGVITFDVSVPISQMEEYLRLVENDLKQIWPNAYFYVFGHLGDSNLHLGVHVGPETENYRHDIEKIVFNRLHGRGGSISAEHGIGLIKRDFIGLSRTPEELALMRKLKVTLDPKNILNPGKIFKLS